ncbi:MAG: Nif3-like dinuclear metal center hexameric protein [Thermodesulfobacteriota bacterium]
MATIGDLLDLIDTLAPWRLAAEWDNCGLQVGRRGAQVHKAALALDPTPPAVRAAHQAGAQALICHHPLIFHPLKRLDLDEPVAATAALALELDLAVLAAHTNLDAAPGGVTQALAERLGLFDFQVLAPAEDDHPKPQTGGPVGFGGIGRLAAPLDFDDLARLVAGELGLPALRAAAPPGLRVEIVAVLPGSGGGYVGLAHEKGAQALITGDVGYHQVREALALGLGVIDAGHFGTERPVLAVLAHNLARTAAGRGLAVEFEVLECEDEPWTYWGGTKP